MIRMRALGAVQSTSSEGAELRAVLAQPKRLALLVYLLLTPAPHFRRRDTLTALFWPELDQEHARSALRQATHFLEQALGDGVITRRGLDEIGFDVDAVWCDVHAFDACCDRGTAVDALALYRGELLEGWFISDAAPELERWLDGERDRLRRRASEVAGLAAEKSASRGELLVAEAQARRAATLAPYDEKAIRRVLGILDVRGDRASAVQLYDAFARRLADEYGAEPSVESKAAIADIRRRAGQTGGRQNLTKLEALFSVEREVSRSSFSTVYTARDLRHDRVVTLKVLSPTLTAALARERFQREIRLLARLQHWRIVPLYDSGEADGVLYYVMPFVAGDTLRERLAVQAPLAPAEAISIACQVADALAYVHAHDVVLRDLKPDGILLTPDGAVLGDFRLCARGHAGGRQTLDEDRHGAGHAGVHESGAGGGGGRNRPSDRHLRTRVRAVRDAERSSALHRCHRPCRDGKAPRSARAVAKPRRDRDTQVGGTRRPASARQIAQRSLPQRRSIRRRAEGRREWSVRQARLSAPCLRSSCRCGPREVTVTNGDGGPAGNC